MEIDSRVIQFNEATEFKDTITYTAAALSLKSIFSVLQCAGLCMERDTCLSLYYNTDKAECRMYDTDIISSMEVYHDKGWRYYYGFRDLPDKEVCEAELQHYGKQFTYVPEYYLCYSNKAPASAFICDRVCGIISANQFKVDRPLKQKFLMEFQATNPGSYLLIQGKKSNTGEWLFLDNAPMTYFYWGDGEPSNGVDEIYIGIAPHTNHTWHAIKQMDGGNCFCTK